MAFMMPVMKKNYAIYGKQQRAGSDPENASVTGRKVKTPHPPSTSAHPAHRRRVKSEGTSLSTSPATVMSGAEALQAHMQSKSKPIGMRRGRGSAPVLAPSASLNHHVVTGPTTTVPTGSAPVPKFQMSSPSRSTSSSSSSSGSQSNLGRFHTKLVARLRRSLRLKDPEPTTS